MAAGDQDIPKLDLLLRYNASEESAMDAQSTPRSVEWDASAGDCKAISSSGDSSGTSSLSDHSGEEQFESDSSSSECGSQVERTSGPTTWQASSLETCKGDLRDSKSKVRSCEYVRYLLNASMHAATVTQLPSSKTVLEYFELFRKSLQCYAAERPDLRGDPTDEEPIGESAFVTFGDSTPLTVDAARECMLLGEKPHFLNIGVCNNVRAIAVLETAEMLLRAEVRDLKGNQLTHTQVGKLMSIFQWLFAAFANLDTLQAVDADVAFLLQSLRRHCSGIYAHIGQCVQDEEIKRVQQTCAFIECIVRDFFNQR